VRRRCPDHGLSVALTAWGVMNPGSPALWPGFFLRALHACG